MCCAFLDGADKRCRLGVLKAEVLHFWVYFFPLGIFNILFNISYSEISEAQTIWMSVNTSDSAPDFYTKIFLSAHFPIKVVCLLHPSWDSAESSTLQTQLCS